MRFYYQAQDMDSGQKVGLVLFFQIKLKLFYHCNPQIPSSLLWDSVVSWPIDSENLLKHSSGHHPLQKVMYTRALQTLALEINKQNVMKCVVFFYFEPLFFAQNNDQEIFVAHLIVFSGRNQMYTSLKHGHKQGSHRNSHREIPARYEDVGGNHKQVKVTRISTEYVFRCLSTPCTKSMSQGREDLGWTKSLCLSNLIGTGKESSYWHISQTEDKFRYCYVHCAVSVILECT